MALSFRKPIRGTEREYFASGDWKCAGSATGGHRWNCNIQPNICKICGKTKADLQAAAAMPTYLPPSSATRDS